MTLSPQPARRFGLRTLFMLAVTLILITTSALLGSLLIRDWAAYLQSDLEAKGISLARSLASHAEYGVLVGDREGLSRLIEGLRHDADLTWAAVIDADRSQLAAGPAEHTPRWQASQHMTTTKRDSSASGGVDPVVVSRLTSDTGAWVLIEAPVTTVPVVRSREDVALSAPSSSRAAAAPERIGTVKLVLSLARVEAALLNARRVVAWVTLLVVTVGILLAVPMAHLILRSVQQLVAASRRIAQGELEVQVPESSSRELSELAHAFNQMSASLRDRDRRLSESAAELERRAEALHGRQGELEAANRALLQLNEALHLSQAQLSSTNAELLHISGLKSAFLASMSHELRTPLNSIIGYTECMVDGLDGPINEEQRESLERVRRNGRHLLTLINEILDLSRIEAGRMELSVSSLAPDELAEECVATIRPLLRDRPIALRCALEPPIPQIRADASRLRQVLINLLSNAVKFTDEGEVVLHVREAGDGIELEVRDTGRGIPNDKLEEIFLEFQRLEGPTTAGTGLGLAITRRLVELMSGTIRVESEVGVGSKFRVWLPTMHRALNSPST